MVDYGDGEFWYASEKIRDYFDRKVRELAEFMQERGYDEEMFAQAVFVLMDHLSQKHPRLLGIVPSPSQRH